MKIRKIGDNRHHGTVEMQKPGKRATTSNSLPIASMWRRRGEMYMSVRFSILAIEGC